MIDMIKIKLIIASITGPFDSLNMLAALVLNDIQSNFEHINQEYQHHENIMIIQLLYQQTY